MSPTLQLLILASAAIIATADDQSSEKPPSCQEFSRGVTFNDSQALGTWHLLHYRTETTKGSGESHCVKFSTIDDEERKKLSNRIGKALDDLKFENLVLKMQIPCASFDTSNKTRDYYLEKLAGADGSYRTLQLIARSTIVDKGDFHRYPMRLKMIEGQFLGMMDCHEKFVFLLGKEPPQGKMLDERLQKMIETYWPEEH